jgi:hypothetical protein
MTILLRALAFAGALALSTGGALAWGAIAIDDEQGQSAADIGYGYVTGEDSEDAARRGALRECRKRNTRSCKVVLTFEECGAYAVDRRNWGSSEGKSEASARRNSLLQCGSGTCRVAVSVCN